MISSLVDVQNPLPVRLSGSSLAWVGYVQVDLLDNNKLWSSVCSNGWDMQDATVVCKQLGYTNAIGAIVNPIFGKSKYDNTSY